ncbi:hypothetical protein LINPERHAP1_LOCUS34696 [Linum perenne]
MFFQRAGTPKYLWRQMGGKDRSNNSLCEKSMKVVVNIIRLSSFSIAKMSLGTAGSGSGSPVLKRNLAPMTNSAVATKEPLLPQIPGSRRSQEPQTRSNHKSFLMEPGKGNGSSSCMVHEESSVIDGKASDYIRKVHEKNRNDASKLAPLILPPPPRKLSCGRT